MRENNNIHSSKTDVYARLLASCLYGLGVMVSWLPAWFLYYPLAEFIYFILYYVVRYRVKVARENLKNSFPEKEAKELRHIERKYYHHLAEVFVDTIDMTGISRKELQKRMIIIGDAEHRQVLDDKDWIAALAHYGSWEYFMVYALGDREGRETIGVYRTLHSKVMDIFYRRMRSRMKLQPVSMSVFLRHVIKDRKEGIGMSIGLIADQSPQWFKIDHWYNFLNQPTAFFNGMENIALRFGMPIYFLNVKKTRRAHYVAQFECIYDGVESVEPHEITARYAAKLEEMIRRQPELWLWSHKRWKYKPQDIGECQG